MSGGKTTQKESERTYAFPLLHMEMRGGWASSVPYSTIRKPNNVNGLCNTPPQNIRNALPSTNTPKVETVTPLTALFVAKDSIYKSFDFIDCWDEERDARKYIGFDRVIAHPPCQKWGAMAKVNFSRWGGKHNAPWNDGGCFFSALAAVRLNGGVLEHPAKSQAWNFFGLTKPERGKWIKARDGYGWVCEVWQSAYGHRANKATWLYYVGNEKPYDLDWSRPVGSCQVGFHDQRGKEKNKPTLSRKEANATPIGFALELIKMARPVPKNRAEKGIKLSVSIPQNRKSR